MVHQKVTASPPPSTAVATTVEQVKVLQPADDAGTLSWAEWHEHMAGVYREQANVQARLRMVETTVRSQGQQIDDLAVRLERLEEAQETMLDLLELLQPERLSRSIKASCGAGSMVCMF